MGNAHKSETEKTPEITTEVTEADLNLRALEQLPTWGPFEVIVDPYAGKRVREIRNQAGEVIETKPLNKVTMRGRLPRPVTFKRDDNGQPITSKGQFDMPIREETAPAAFKEFLYLPSTARIKVSGRLRSQMAATGDFKNPETDKEPKKQPFRQFFGEMEVLELEVLNIL